MPSICLIHLPPAEASPVSRDCEQEVKFRMDPKGIAGPLGLGREGQESCSLTPRGRFLTAPQGPAHPPP